MRSHSCRLTVYSILAATLALGVSAAEPVLATRTFTLRHVELAEAVRAVEPLLSADGSLTADSAARRLIVRDSLEVLARVADAFATVDRAPEAFRVGFELLEASNTPFDGSAEVRQDAKLSTMLRYAHFRVIGSARIEGRVGDASSAALAKGFRLSFDTEVARVPMSPGRLRARAVNDEENPSPPGEQGGPAGRRPTQELVDTLDRASEHVLLNPLTLERLTTGAPIELLRTRVLLAPGQQTVLAVSRSEGSDRALVLVVRAERPEAG